MSEYEGLDEHLASLQPEADRDAGRARTVSGVRCRACGHRSPDVELAGEQCPKCSRGYMATIARTELRAKECKRCGEQFLWRYNVGDAENALKHAKHDFYKGLKLHGPDNCRACEEEAGAAHKYQAAKRQYEKSKKVRVEQRAAVARFKPKS